MIEQTEIEQALEISRKTRQEILFGKNTLEKNLHGFYTVAQILGHEEEMSWAKNELSGYISDCPKYRKNIQRDFFYNNMPIKGLIKNSILRVDCHISMSSIIKILDEKQAYNPSYFLSEIDFKYIQEHCTKYRESIDLQYFITKENIVWKFNKLDLTEIADIVKLELTDKLNKMIAEITYGQIPEGIFKKFQKNVNSTLTNSNSAAVSELNIAFEELRQSEDPERTSHVAFGCRRLIKAVADELFPSQKAQYITKDKKNLQVGEEHFLNRLEAFVDSTNSSNRKFLVRKIGLLRDLYGEIPESINKGTHLNISNSGAEMLVIYTYIILGDIILEKNYEV